MNLKEAYALAIAQLREHRCPESDPEREAAELLSVAAECPPERLLAHSEDTLTSDQEDALHDLIGRRIRHEPIERLRGQATFLGRPFTVSPSTLIPRPATEILVEAALRRSDGWQAGYALDVGTGSGCIAVTLAGSLPELQLIATDTSAEALRTAQLNAEAHLVADRITFLLGDLIAPTGRHLPDRTDLAVFANLPYVPADHLVSLSPEVRDFEPPTALYGGPDGLDLYRRLLDQISVLGRELQPTSVWLFAEHLPGQRMPLDEEIKRRFGHSTTETIETESTDGPTVIGTVARLI